MQLYVDMYEFVYIHGLNALLISKANAIVRHCFGLKPVAVVLLMMYTSVIVECLLLQCCYVVFVWMLWCCFVFGRYIYITISGVVLVN